MSSHILYLVSKQYWKSAVRNSGIFTLVIPAIPLNKNRSAELSGWTKCPSENSKIFWNLTSCPAQEWSHIWRMFTSSWIVHWGTQAWVHWILDPVRHCHIWWNIVKPIESARVPRPTLKSKRISFPVPLRASQSAWSRPWRCNVAGRLTV